MKTAIKEINGEMVEVQIIDSEFYRKNSNPRRDEEIETNWDLRRKGDYDPGRAFLRDPKRGVE